MRELSNLRRVGPEKGNSASPLYIQHFVAHFNQMSGSFLSGCLGAIAFGAALWAQPAARAALAKAAVLEGDVAYLRVSQTGNNLPQDISSALDRFSATNKIAGIVLDLRFAGGAGDQDLPAVENQLERPDLPLAILINAQTAGAAVKLAEDLRETDAGLVFGATADHFRPDIAVSVGTNAEESFLKNPYGSLDASNQMDADTNILPYADIDHTTEADLVRDKIKDGDENPDESPPLPSPAPARPFIRDPVLARGVDFIKGLAALRLSKELGNAYPQHREGG